MKSITAKITAALGDRRFYICVLAFFILESAWIAVSAAYPQAFDENFHFGIIKMYSHYWLPFLSGQPPDANVFGAVARDPSYLYQYLMSFPYRVIELFTHNQAIQVIILRFLDIGFFATGLILFRRVLLRVGISRNLTHVTLLLFALIPIVPQLAAQVNYDDLLFPLVAWVCLLTFQVVDELRMHHPSVRTLSTLTIVCLLTGLVKYAFLPIFLGVVLFVLTVGYRNFRGNFRSLRQLLAKSFRSQSLLAKTVLIGLLLLSISMFVQRDGVNLVKYHAIEPDCGLILSVHDCSAYSVWHANYIDHARVLANPSIVSHNPVYYMAEWFYWMWYRLFFSIAGPSKFTNYPPLPLPSAAAGIIGILGCVAIIRWWRRIFHNNIYLVFLFVASASYLAALLVQGYTTYRYTAVLENMNGRYLLPILLMTAALAGRAFSIALHNSQARKALAVVAVLILFLQGGGVLTFIARSDNTWDWQNGAVVKVNNAARKVTDPVLVNGKKTYRSKLWFFN